MYKSSGPRITLKSLVYKSLLRSIMTYVYSDWGYDEKKLISKLQTFLNKSSVAKNNKNYNPTGEKKNRNNS